MGVEQLPLTQHGLKLHWLLRSLEHLLEVFSSGHQACQRWTLSNCLAHHWIGLQHG